MSEPLSYSEVEELLQSVSISIYSVLLWRIKIRRLKNQLAKDEINEDDSIYNDLYKFVKSAKYVSPQKSNVFSLNGVEIKVTISHRHKSESIFGIDLV
jgi:hypothetical protein